MLVISLVTHKNPISDLEKLVSSIGQYTGEYFFYVLDNSPTPELKNFFAKCENVTKYVHSRKNIGFSRGHNKISQYLKDIDYKYHLIINPDIYFKAGTLEAIVEYMDKNPNIGQTIPKVYYPDGRTQYAAKLLPMPINLFIRRFCPFEFIKKINNDYLEMRWASFDKEIEAPYLSGSFMFLRREAWQDTKGFDKNIFMYIEDGDLTRRINQKWRTTQFLEASIVHAYHQEHRKNIKLLLIHIKSIIYYCNKWGWFFDKNRKVVNKAIVKANKLIIDN